MGRRGGAVGLLIDGSSGVDALPSNRGFRPKADSSISWPGRMGRACSGGRHGMVFSGGF